jgi:hypothetical protein
MRHSKALCAWTSALLVSAVATTAWAAPADVVISEWRTSTSEGGPKDEFIELHNTTCAPIEISNYVLRYGSCKLTDPAAGQILATIPAGTILPPHGFYLLANTGFQSFASPDQKFAAGFAEMSDTDGGIALMAKDVIVDASGLCDVDSFPKFPYREGKPVVASTHSGEWSYTRSSPYPEGSSYCLPDGDTDRNADDFSDIDTFPSPQGSTEGECDNVPGTCESPSGLADKVTGRCSFAPQPAGASCEDGNGCTIGDTCDGGRVCMSGETCPALPPVCDANGNAVIAYQYCLYDDVGKGQSAVNHCEASESSVEQCPFGCAAGACLPDPCDPVACKASAAPECYTPGTGQCVAGKCEFQAQEPGSACDDGSLCTENDTCQIVAGTQTVACIGTPATIDDKNDCTIDDCTPTGGVTNTFVANGTPCLENDNACDGVFRCQVGACVLLTDTVDCASLAGPCDDPESGSCDKATGLCSYSSLPANTVCDDGSGCSVDDHCDAAGQCVGSAVLCDEKPPTCLDGMTSISYVGSCQGALCNYAETSTTCASGCDETTGACVDAPCGGGCGGSEDPCVVRECDLESNTCVDKPRVNTSCDDGDVCTVDDLCADLGDGVIGCLGTAAVCNKPPLPACKDDGVTSVIYAPTGVCVGDGAGCSYEAQEIVCELGCDGATGQCGTGAGGSGGVGGSEAGGAGAGGSDAGAAGSEAGGLGGSEPGGSDAGTAGEGGADAAGTGGASGTGGTGGGAKKGGTAGKKGAAEKGGAAGEASGLGGKGQAGSSVSSSGRGEAAGANNGSKLSTDADLRTSDIEGGCQATIAGEAFLLGQGPSGTRSLLLGALGLVVAAWRRRRTS